jgi:hypothetical protein
MTSMRQTLQRAKSKGKKGDTDIVHVNPREKAMLKARGGVGSLNPDTGLRQYYSDSANEHSRADTGHNMADHDRPSSGGGSRSADAGRADTSGGNYSGGYHGGGYQGSGVGMPGKPGLGGFGSQAAPGNKNGWTGADAGKAATAAKQQQDDGLGLNDNVFDKIGNALAGAFGWHETSTPAHDLLSAAHAGTLPGSVHAQDNVNVLQGIGSLAGLATGLPIGTAIHAASYLHGSPIGPNVKLGDPLTGSNDLSMDWGGIGGTGSGAASPGHDQDGGGAQGGGPGIGGLYHTLAQPPVATHPPAFDSGVGGGNPNHPKVGSQPTGARQYSAPSDWLHYGENGGEWQFFNPSQLAKGGRVDPRAKMGRNGDSVIAHISPFEAKIMDAWQGGKSINPLTGEREYFKFGKVLKGLVKAAGAIAGGYVGGPVGAAIGGGLAAKLTGSSWESALGTGLLSGIGGYAAQQTGIGDMVGGGLGSGANLLGQAGDAAASGAASSSSGGIGSLAKLLPIVGIGAAALSGGPKTPKSTTTSQTSGGDPYAGPQWDDYQTDPRHQRGGPEDYYHYGENGGEYQWYDNVNPVPHAMEKGGSVKGAGDGQSDSIPAMLSDGEHVIDAQTVSAIGAGSNDAGHKKIEQMKKHVRKKAGMTKKPKMYGVGSLARAAA